MRKKGVTWRQLLPAILFVVVLVIVLFIVLQETSYGHPFDALKKSLGLGVEEGKEPVITTLEKIKESDVQKPEVSSLNLKADIEYKKGNWEGALDLYEDSYSRQKNNDVKDRLLELLKEKAEFYEKDGDFESAKEVYLRLKNLGENVDAKLSYVGVELNKPPQKYNDVEYDECKGIRSFTRRHECAAEGYAQTAILIGTGYSPEEASEHERSMILEKYQNDKNKFAKATLLKQYEIFAENSLKKHYYTYEAGQKNKRDAYDIYYALLDKFWVDDKIRDKLKEAYTKDGFNYLSTSFSKLKFSLSLKTRVYASPYDQYVGWWWKPKAWIGSISRGEEKKNKFVVKLEDLYSEDSWSMLPKGVHAPRSERDIDCIAIVRFPGQLTGSGDNWELEYEARDLLGQRLCGDTHYSTGSGPFTSFNKDCDKYFKISAYTQITCDVKGDQEWMEFKLKGDFVNLAEPSDILDWTRWSNLNLRGKVW